MAFKSKIKPNEVKDMDFKTYTATLKKEINKAAKFGETNVVAFSNYKFSQWFNKQKLTLNDVKAL